jgi:hypothetical protein
MQYLTIAGDTSRIWTRRGRIILSRSLGWRLYEVWLMIFVTSELRLAALNNSRFATAVFIRVKIKLRILTKNFGSWYSCELHCVTP